MKINPTSNVYKNQQSFGRSLSSFEKIESRVLNEEAKKAIGLENLVLVTHTPSLPSTGDEDTGIGVLSKNKGTLSYIDFAYNNGIDGIMIEPQGIIKGEYYSPYEASLMSKKAVADLKALTQSKWANILPYEVYKQAVDGKEYKGAEKDRVIYDFVLPTHEEALQTAYDNFKQKVAEGDKKALDINKGFEQYKKDNAFYLTTDAIFNILSTQNDGKSFGEWNSKLHRTLFDTSDKTYSKAQKDAEIARIKEEHKDEIDFHMFSQFVIDKQQEEVLDYAANIARLKMESDLYILQATFEEGKITAAEHNFLSNKVKENAKASRGVSIIGDKPVGYSAMDVWSNPTLFTKTEYLGAPPNVMKARMGQDWDFSFIPREKLFEQDGRSDKLAEGGVYLKSVFKKMLKDNPGGLRIDHVLGLIDPWTYEKNSNTQMTHGKFRVLLSTDLKELNELGINPDAMKGIKDPVGAITNPASPERKILESRGVWDFNKATKIVTEKKDAVERVLTNQSNQGSRYVFKLMLDTHLKGLRELGFNEDTIKEIIDPIGGIYGTSEADRYILGERGIWDFDKAKAIVEANKEAIVKEYGKILDKILVEACRETVIEKAAKQGETLSEDEILKRARAMVVCEDLGSSTIPLQLVMEKFKLTGMRHSAYADPNDPNNKYREGNPTAQGHYLLVGTHDDSPYIDHVKNPNYLREANANYISSELGIDRAPLMDVKNPHTMMRAKIARLISADNNPQTPNNVILNWLDLFGKTQRYNTPGLNDAKANWTLRVTSSDKDFEQEYYDKTLVNQEGINMPKAYAVAMKANGVSSAQSQVYEGLKKYEKIVEEKAY